MRPENEIPRLRALAVAMVVMASAVGANGRVVPSSRLPDLADRLRALATDLGCGAMEELPSAGDEVYAARVETAWLSWEDFAVAALDESRALPADELACLISDAANAPCPGSKALKDAGGSADNISVLALRSGRRDAVVIALGLGWSGTVSLAERGKDSAWRIVWRIRDAGAEHLPSRDELGRWAWLDAGFHDGALGGRVLPLPPTPSGEARFLVDALSRPSMGDVRPGQLSVWRWSGGAPTLDFIGGYLTSAAVWDTRVEGSRIAARTVEDPRSFFFCGSCDNYVTGSWTIELAPDGVVDLGHRWDSQELQLVDRLLADALDCLPTPSDVSTVGYQTLREYLEANFEHGTSGHSLGMLGHSGVEPDASGVTLELSTDEFPRSRFRIVERDGFPFVSAVSFPEGWP